MDKDKGRKARHCKMCKSLLPRRPQPLNKGEDRGQVVIIVRARDCFVTPIAPFRERANFRPLERPQHRDLCRKIVQLDESFCPAQSWKSISSINLAPAHVWGFCTVAMKSRVSLAEPVNRSGPIAAPRPPSA